MKTAVVYWSGTGNTEAIAQAVAEGMTAAGAEAALLTHERAGGKCAGNLKRLGISFTGQGKSVSGLQEIIGAVYGQGCAGLVLNGFCGAVQQIFFRPGKLTLIIGDQINFCLSSVYHDGNLICEHPAVGGPDRRIFLKALQISAVHRAGLVRADNGNVRCPWAQRSQRMIHEIHSHGKGKKEDDA